jgi:hypothetical protein
MTVRQLLRTAGEWMFRTAAVREARAAIVDLDARRAQALAQARLLLEVAQRVKHPVEKLPKGKRPSALAGLYRDAIYWSLVVQAPGDDAPAELQTLWATCEADPLLRAAGGERRLAAARRVLFETPASRWLDVSADDAANLGALATALVDDLDSARRKIDRLLSQRGRRILLLFAVVVLLIVGVRRMVTGRDLASGIVPRVSSSWPGCASDPPCPSLLFHSQPESNPWVEFDLAAPKPIRRIDVTNRHDCCADRAVPLIAEISTDRVGWSEVGRRDTEFSRWTVEFPPRVARYVRLRVPRFTTFHLKDVAIH